LTKPLIVSLALLGSLVLLVGAREFSRREALPAVTTIPIVIGEGGEQEKAEATSTLRSAYEDARARGNPDEVILATQRLVSQLEREGRREEALRAVLDSLDIARESRAGSALVVDAARMLDRQGDVAAAQRLLEDSAARLDSDSRGPTLDAAMLWLELGELLLKQHQFEFAENALRTALSRSDGLSDPVLSGAALHALQLLEELRGDDRAASEVCQKRFELMISSRDSSIDSAAKDCVRLLESIGDTTTADATWERARVALSEIAGLDAQRRPVQQRAAD
jgi:tetratricopeptide (TPR) repeat protein